MKKLYENIEDIDIRGGIDQLSEMVQAMDRSLQNIADCTDQLFGLLVKYSATNKGMQYQRVVRTAMDLRDEMFEASMELNDMQNQVVAYQNKIYRFEEMVEAARRPNPYLVTKRKISVDTSIIQFSRSEMLIVAAALKNYRERVYHHIKSINEKKNSIAAVWRDTQYKDFAEFVDEVRRNVAVAILIFDDYREGLSEKIGEIN